MNKNILHGGFLLNNESRCWRFYTSSAIDISFLPRCVEKYIFLRNTSPTCHRPQSSGHDKRPNKRAHNPPAVRRPVQLSNPGKTKPVWITFVHRHKWEVPSRDGKGAIAECERYSHICVAWHGPRPVLVLCAWDRSVYFGYVLMYLSVADM